MTQGISGTASISDDILAIHEDAIFVAREAMIMPSLCTPYNSGGWEDRKLFVYPQISAATVGETDDFVNPTAFGKTLDVTLTPAEVMAQSILTDRRLETDRQSARADCATELGNAVGDKIEGDLLALFDSFTDDHSATGGTAVFALQLVGNAIASLRTAKARGPFYVVLHPYHWLDVWNEIGKPSTSLVPSDVASGALRDYFVANLVNAQWYQHANIDTTGNKATSAVFNREALAFDTRRAPRLEAERDASKRAWELNETAGYAVGVRKASCGAKIEADCTAP
jgi:hypothetical protein